jgi:hypothetical protein
MVNGEVAFTFLLATWRQPNPRGVGDGVLKRDRILV